MTPEQRLEAFRKLAAERPGDAFAGYSLAMQLRSMGRHAEAAEAFERLAAAVPGYLPTWLMWGQVLEQLGQVEAAARAYREGIAQASGQSNQHARGELEEALGRLAAG
jgi:tetratricopeptide (TPR) repeat protein